MKIHTLLALPCVLTFAQADVSDRMSRRLNRVAQSENQSRQIVPPMHAEVGVNSGRRTRSRKDSSVEEKMRKKRVAVLNRLRDAVNSAYGKRDGAPRINLGPCGRFARDFRERWNARFREKINIVFVMTPDQSYCYHVIVRLPDGSYYDGGNGVMTAKTVQKHYPNSRLDEMTDFDAERLDRWSYGLGRSYPECPNYSDKLTLNLVDRHLAQLPASSQ